MREREIEDNIRRFIVEELHFADAPDRLGSDFPLIERNVLDSLGLFNLVAHLEGEFGIEVLDEELVPDHFGTIGDIARFVQSKRARGGVEA